MPIAMALHIPAGYTASLAERLSHLGSISVVEVKDGTELLPGHAYLAPGGMHLTIRHVGPRLFAAVSREPLQTLHHPSVDLLFQSAAEAAGDGVVAVIMTGMGNDGFEGTKLIRARGGRVIAESASSCIVYGMPRCVIEGGTSNFEAALENLPALIVKQIFQ